MQSSSYRARCACIIAACAAAASACASAHDYVADAPVPRTPVPSTPSEIVPANNATTMGIVAPPDVTTPPSDAITTASGLVYKPLLRSYTSATPPTRSDIVTVYYVGWTTSGRPFDDRLRPAEPSQAVLRTLVPGLVEGIQLMRPGERFRFWIPQALVLAGASGMPPGALTYDVELVAVAAAKAPPEVKVETPEVPADVAEPPQDARRTPSGLTYKVLRPGKGPSPSRANKVRVHYSGWTTDGDMFDSSRVRGEPATFPVNAVIPGFSEGLELMQVGSSMRFWIPENLAYKGAPGRPKGMLVFDVELLGIE